MSYMDPHQLKFEKRKKAAIRQAARRARLARVGSVVVRIELSKRDASLLQDLAQKQKGPLKGFSARALIIGAKFLANAGVPVGKKVR